MSAQMRRSDRALTDDEARGLFEKCTYGVLSTVDQDGDPYGIPMCYIWDVDGVVVHGTPHGTKFDLLSSSGRASFCVVGDTQVLPGQFAINYESAVISGGVAELTEDDKTRALMGFVRKFSPGFEGPGAQYVDKAVSRVCLYKIRAEKISGKARRPHQR